MDGKSRCTNFAGKAIGVACEKLQPIAIEHDLCSMCGFNFPFSIEPLLQLGMLDISPVFTVLMIDLVAHDVTQTAANAGLAAMTKININDTDRIYLNIGKLYHLKVVSARPEFSSYGVTHLVDSDQTNRCQCAPTLKRLQSSFKLANGHRMPK